MTFDPVKEAERIVSDYDPRSLHPAYRHQIDEAERRAVAIRGRWRMIGVVVGFIVFSLGAWFATPDAQPVGIEWWFYAIGFVAGFELIGQRIYRRRSPW